MPTFYVNKSGSDTNGGASHADAFLTIQKGIDTAADGDEVRVGFGVYEENLSMTTEKSITVRSDAFAILEGGVVGGTAITAQSNLNGQTLTIDGFHIQNYGRAADMQINNGHVRLLNCYIKDCVDVLDNGRAKIHTLAVLSNCVMDNTKYSTGNFFGTHITRRIENVTFVNNSEDVTLGNSGAFTFVSCHFDAATSVNASFTPTDLALLDYSNVRGNIVYKGTTYTLATFQTAYPTLAASSFDKNPHFNNQDDGESDYTLNPASSPNIGNGLADVDIGGRGAARWYDSANDVFSESKGAIYTGVGRDADGFFDLETTPTASLKTAVISFDSPKSLGDLLLLATETYPTHVIDSDNTDSKPNRPTVLWRGSNTLFVSTDPTPAWVAVERETDLASTYEHVQFDFVFRDNGAAS